MRQYFRLLRLDGKFELRIYEALDGEGTGKIYNLTNEQFKSLMADGMDIMAKHYRDLT